MITIVWLTSLVKSIYNMCGQRCAVYVCVKVREKKVK